MLIPKYNRSGFIGRLNMTKNLVLAAAERVVLWFWNSKEVKNFVVVLLERYSKSTDNDVDDLVVKLVRDALIKE